MKIKVNEAMFFVDLFGGYRNKLYLHMRKDKYSMKNIKSFINGYSIIPNYLTHYVMGIMMLDTSKEFNMIIINNCEEALNLLDTAVDYSIELYDTLDDWEKVGFKYSICLAEFYIKHIIFGNYTEVADDDSVYVPIPEENELDSFDWIEAGLSYVLEV